MKRTTKQKGDSIKHLEVEVEGHTYLATIRMSREDRGQYIADWVCPKTKQEGELNYSLGNAYEVELAVETEIRKRHFPPSQAA